jgi:hypothetical protein
LEKGHSVNPKCVRYMVSLTVVERAVRGKKEGKGRRRHG